MTTDFIPLLEPSPSDAPTRRTSKRGDSARRSESSSQQWTRDADRHLVRGLLNREPAAWREFVERYERLIASQILATCRETGQNASTDLVEDCGAEVMAALMHGEMSGLRKFEGRSKLSTWLAIVIRRTTLTFLRKRERDRAAALQPDSRLDLQMIPDRQAETPEYDTRDRDLLQLCLQQLSHVDRQILKLQIEENWSYAQIAAKLGVSENAVGPKIHRARSRLKKLMQRMSPDGPGNRDN
jgi:RNA polymerase sigma-70 factor (ECF subfamily)